MICFAYTEHGMLGMLDTFCGLFWRKALYHMWTLGPNQHFFKVLRTHREYLIYIYNKYLCLVLCQFQHMLEIIGYLCVHTGVDLHAVPNNRIFRIALNLEEITNRPAICPETTEMLRVTCV